MNEKWEMHCQYFHSAYVNNFLTFNLARQMNGNTRDFSIQAQDVRLEHRRSKLFDTINRRNKLVRNVGLNNADYK
jgi:hypothetical protein